MSNTEFTIWDDFTLFALTFLCIYLVSGYFTGPSVAFMSISAVVAIVLSAIVLVLRRLGEIDSTLASKLLQLEAIFIVTAGVIGWLGSLYFDIYNPTFGVPVVVVSLCISLVTLREYRTRYTVGSGM